MRMEIGSAFEMRNRNEQSMSPETRMAAVQKRILKLLQLPPDHREIPNAVRGFEGMIDGHEMLKKFGRAGVLIGGLAEEIYGSGSSVKTLGKHKDVDIALIEDYENEESRPPLAFEGGIDWWNSVPIEVTKERQYKGEKAIRTRKVLLWKNGFDAFLRYSISTSSLGYRIWPPGLYIPSAESVAEMRLREALQFARERIRSKNEEYSQSELEAALHKVEKKYYQQVLKRLKNPLVKEVEETFEDYLVGEREKRWLRFDPMRHF